MMTKYSKVFEQMIMFSSFLVFMLFICSCNPAMNGYRSVSDLPDDWTLLVIEGREYIAKSSKQEYITHCLMTAGIEECLKDLSAENPEVRKVKKPMDPLRELTKINGDFEISFTMFVDSEGIVLMNRIDHFTENVSPDLAKKAAVNNLGMIYVKDEKEACMNCSQYKIRMSKKPLQHD